MKTSFLKIAAVVLMMTGAKASLASDTVNGQNYTDLTWINNFDRIEVHGNVQLHLISGEKNRVEMSDSYFDHNALVQVEKGVLRITCYREQRLNVWVTAADLRQLDAYDNVQVQSEGKFSALELDLALHNQAKADLDLDCITANVKLNDKSMADISGYAVEGELISNYAATLNCENFKTEYESALRINPILETTVTLAADTPDQSFFTLPDDDQRATGNKKEIRFTTASKKPVNLDIPKDVQSVTLTHAVIN